MTLVTKMLVKKKNIGGIKMKKVLSIMLSVALLVTLFTSCTPKEVGSESEDLPGGSGKELKDTFTVALPAEIMTLNPMKVTDSWGASAILNVHDPLVRLDENGKLLPALAESWKISDDGLEYTFYLRKNVTFHDGTTFTAKDVKYTLERAMTEPTGARFTAGFKSVEIINDYECILKIESPMAATLNYLAQANNCIVSESVMDKIGQDEYKTNPCGTGPFKFKEWIPGDRVIYTANEDYYLGAPAIKTLIVRNIGDKSASLIALETGDIDAIVEAASSDKQTVLSNPKLAWYETPSAVYYSLQLNNNKKPFDDVRVRRALDMAVNREEIIAIALDGQGAPAHIGISNYGNGYTDEIKNAPYDPEMAKTLLTEAGFPNGFKTNIYVRDDFMKKAGQVIQSNWAKIGVEAKVNVMERGALLLDMYDGKLEAPMSMATDLPFDGSLHLNTLDSRYQGHNGANFSFYSNPEMDRLNKLQIGESDPAKRNEIIKEMLKIEKTDVPTIPLFYPVVNLVMNADVKGLESPYPTNIYFWYKIHW